MLKEVVPRARQNKEQDGDRRWFRSRSADLYIWPASQDDAGSIPVRAFEYCYRDLYKEHYLSWDKQGGFRYARIDDGETSPLTNDTPLVVPNGDTNAAFAARHFREQGVGIDLDIYQFVLHKLYEQLGPTNL